MYAMYLRKSRADDPNEDINETLAKHEKILFELADSLKINKKEIMHFKEVVSGENIKNRPQMKKLLEYVMNGVFEGVLVVDSQRLARGDTLDQGTIIRAFGLNGTKIITPMKTIDPGNEYDQEYFEFDLFMGRREYKMINRRMQRGRYISVQEGYYVGSVAPYGYKRKKLEKGYTLEIDPEEYKIFKIMKELALDGMGCTNIAKELNKLGYIPRKSEKWTTSAVRDILLNKTNLGLIKWNSRKKVSSYKNGEIITSRPINDEIELYEGKHTAIITQEEYDTIVKYMKARSNYKVKKAFKLCNPLAGLIICADCGRFMIRRPYGNGRKDTLICQYPGCHNVSCDLEIVERKIIDALKVVLSDYKTFINNYNDQEEKNYLSLKKQKIEEIDKEIDTSKNQITKACEMLEIGAYTVDLFKERKTTLENKINALIEEKEVLEKETGDTKAEQYRKAIPKIEKALELYWDGTVEEKNMLLKSIIKKCVYKKEKSGRWHPEETDNIKLEIHMKL